MKTKRKKFDRNRIIEFCKLVNSGMSPTDALYKLKACREYASFLRQSGIVYKVDNTWYAIERLSDSKYNSFVNIRYQKNKIRNERYQLPLEQNKTRKKKKLNTIQKFIKNIFNV